VLGEREPETAEMKFGKKIDDFIDNDPDFLPQVPRLNKYQHRQK